MPDGRLAALSAGSPPLILASFGAGWTYTSPIRRCRTCFWDSIASLDQRRTPRDRARPIDVNTLCCARQVPAVCVPQSKIVATANGFEHSLTRSSARSQADDKPLDAPATKPPKEQLPRASIAESCEPRRRLLSQSPRTKRPAHGSDSASIEYVKAISNSISAYQCDARAHSLQLHQII